MLIIQREGIVLLVEIGFDFYGLEYAEYLAAQAHAVCGALQEHIIAVTRGLADERVLYASAVCLLCHAQVQLRGFPRSHILKVEMLNFGQLLRFRIVYVQRCVLLPLSEDFLEVVEDLDAGDVLFWRSVGVELIGYFLGRKPTAVAPCDEGQVVLPLFG